MTGSTAATNTGDNLDLIRIVARSGNRSEISAIEFNSDVLQQIRRRATEQFLRIPRGGLEIGGLLYGLVEREQILILTFRHLAIQYINGPSFSLSTEDLVALGDARRTAPPVGPNGEQLQVVGWWHSHTRSDTSLTEEDSDLHRRFFGSDAPLALIIKPHASDPAQVAVYASNASGTPDPVPAFEFVIGEKSAKVNARPSRLSPPTVAAVHAPQPLPYDVRPLPPSTYESRRGRWKVPALVAAVLIVAAIAITFWRRQPAETPVRLELADSPGGLTIRWKVDPSVAAGAKSALLTITNEFGRAHNVNLAPDELQGGSVVYAASSEKLHVGMTVRSRWSQVYHATAGFRGDPVSPEASIYAERSTAPAPVIPPPPALAGERSRYLEALPAAIVPPPSVTPENSPAKTPPPVRAAQLPPPVPRRDIPNPEIAAPPTIQLTAVTTATGIPAAPTPQLPALRPPASAPVSAPASTPTVSKPSPPRPASGRAIWTGALTSGATLLIDGNRATMGTLTGAIPTRPVRIRVQAADLLDSGLVIYTGSGQERHERPSAANGWNLTTYRPDARRSGTVAVLESPAQTNGWQRVMIRSNSRNLSALVIDWEEIPQQ